MSTPSDLPDVAAEVPLPKASKTDGFSVSAKDILDELTERQVDAIEMIGEESAAGFRPPGQSQVSPGMRYLHASRTIHQLVTDRNRAVGLYLAVATLLWTASSGILNVAPRDYFIVPIESVQRWCLPVTFGIMSLLALFAGFLLIRTRIGLIYEVAKMNALLGLPVGRVSRVNPFSIFFIMHFMISLAGGASGGFFVLHMLLLAAVRMSIAAWTATLVGVLISALLTGLYVVMVLHTTSDTKLDDGARSAAR